MNLLTSVKNLEKILILFSYLLQMKILVVLLTAIVIANSSERNGTDLYLELQKQFSYYTIHQNWFEKIKNCINWYLGTKREQCRTDNASTTMNYHPKFDPSELTVANFYSSSAKRRKVKDVLIYLSDIYHTIY